MRKDTGVIVLSRYRLTDVECQLVFHLIKQVETDGCNLVHYRYEVKKLLQIAKLPEQNKCHLLNIMSELLQKTIHMNKPTGWKKYHWFDTLEWDSADNVLIVGFNGELKQHLLQMRKKYTIRDFKKMNACGIFPWTAAQIEEQASEWQRAAG